MTTSGNCPSRLHFLHPAIQQLWLRGVLVVTTVQLHSAKFELRFCAGSIPAVNKTKRLWQVNHTTETIRHHHRHYHHHHHHQQKQLTGTNYISEVLGNALAVFCKKCVL